MIKNLNNIMRYPEKMPCDKRIHFIAGVIIVAFMSLFTISLFIIVPILILIAWGIEFFQKITKSGQFDNYDAIAVVVGGLVVLMPQIVKGLL